ncbi:alpha/beta hydrolase [Arthrobacter pigmenti]
MTRIGWTTCAACGAIGLGLAALALSPRPAALVLRVFFKRDSTRLLTAMWAHAPASITYKENQPYRDDDPDAVFDLYYPSGTASSLPTVVWIHGGAWISGGAADNVPYFELIAQRGYTVIGLDYSLGPERTYPTAVHQLNDALAYINTHADRLNVDPDKIVLAGDSAGAQLATQLSTLTTNPAYANEVGIKPALSPGQLRGVVLNCGIYDVTTMLETKGLLGWGDGIAIWAYTGTRNFDRSPAVDQMSTIRHVTQAHPPVYISGGNADPLTKDQSVPFAARLRELGVGVNSLFWPDDHVPKLPHEYQFNLDIDEGQLALAKTLEFLDQHLW